MSTLRRCEFFVLRLFQASGYLRLTRTEQAFETPEEVAHALDECRKAVRGIEVARYGILFDWRAPAMTTNAELHKAIVKHTDAFAAPFARRAILVRSAVGQMQVARMSRVHTSAAPELFNDESAAVSYVAWHAALPTS